MHFSLDLRRNNIPIIFTLIEENKVEDVIMYAKIHPKECHKWAKISLNGEHLTRLLPLHFACFMSFHPDAIEAILVSYPYAAQQRETLHKWLPLHIATLKGSSREIIRLLINAYQDGVSVAVPASKQLPIHFATGSGASKEVVEELVYAYPHGLKCKDMNGWLPIHLACIQKASKDVIQLLLELYPESVLETTNRGNTPLKCLQSGGKVWKEKNEVILMIKKYERKMTKRQYRAVPEFERPFLVKL